MRDVEKELAEIFTQLHEGHRAYYYEALARDAEYLPNDIAEQNLIATAQKYKTQRKI